VLNETAFVGDGEAARTGVRGRSIAGDNGIAITDDLGTAISGDHGISIAGHFGYAVAGEAGTASSGRYGTSVAGVGGCARAGVGGAITIAGRDEAGVHYTVTADIDEEVGPSPNVFYELDGHRLTTVLRQDPLPEPADT
jgi:hypothetical protein